MRHRFAPHPTPREATMNRITTTFAAAMLSAAITSAPIAQAGAEELADAMRILDDVNKITTTMATMNVTLTAPTPVADNSGPFLSPYRCDGTPTEWSNKAMTAGAGAMAGGMAAGQAAAAVPFIGGFFKKKAQAMGAQTGAITAAGGMDFIKSSSDMSFNSADELAVYLQAKHAALDPDFAKRVTAAMAIYPDLKTNYTKAVQAAADAAKAAGAAPAPTTAAAPAAASPCK
jgi:hypothetical protein